MKTIVIVGSTRTAAREKLQTIANSSKIRGSEGYDEAALDGYRLLAMGGREEDVCWLVALGFHIKEIITVEPGDISEKMRRRINHVRSTIGGQDDQPRSDSELD